MDMFPEYQDFESQLLLFTVYRGKNFANQKKQISSNYFYYKKQRWFFFEHGKTIQYNKT